MHDPALFTDPENWTGGFYELSLEIGDPDDGRRQRALTVLWWAAAVGRAGRVRLLLHLLRGHRGPVDAVPPPLGAPARVDRRIGGFPFGPDGEPRSPAWRAPLDTWLVGVADEVFRQVDFRIGLVGFEVDHTTAAELGGVVPGQRRNGYLLPVGGRLECAPANRRRTEPGARQPRVTPVSSAHAASRPSWTASS